jgi:hypothetical protein
MQTPKPSKPREQNLQADPLNTPSLEPKVLLGHATIVTVSLPSNTPPLSSKSTADMTDEELFVYHVQQSIALHQGERTGDKAPSLSPDSAISNTAPGTTL